MGHVFEVHRVGLESGSGLAAVTMLVWQYTAQHAVIRHTLYNHALSYVSTIVQPYPAYSHHLGVARHLAHEGIEALIIEARDCVVVG
jgi:hypothetical protein